MKILLPIFMIAMVLGCSAELPADLGEPNVPQIVELEDQWVMAVDFNGDPDEVIKAAYQALFKAYFGTQGTPRGSEMGAPIARYRNFDEALIAANAEDLKAFDWHGFVALPVPRNLQSLDSKFTQGEYPVRLMNLERGLTGEILHLGPYEEEQPQIFALMEHITNQGYVISGLHEEEYIVGPGGFLPKRASRYVTVIRYQIEEL